MKVTKRNGQEVLFNEDKIFLAIYAANEEVFNINPNYAITEEQINEVVDRITELIKSLYRNTNVTVEKIQDLVETVLVAKNYYYIARAYIRYRYKKEMARDQYDILMSEVKNKLAAKNVQNQNANVDEHSFGGRMGEATRAVTKKYAIDYILSDMARENHLNNIIYIHDLDNYAVGNHNCLSIPFDDLLANGFNTRQADVRPANSINTAFQLVAVIFQLQSLQQFGGVSATHLDWTMVPYVRKSFYKHMKDGLMYIEHKNVNEMESMEGYSIDDEGFKRYPKAYNYAIDMTERELKQAVEGMYHNLNY